MLSKKRVISGLLALSLAISVVVVPRAQYPSAFAGTSFNVTRCITAGVDKKVCFELQADVDKAQADVDSIAQAGKETRLNILTAGGVILGVLGVCALVKSLCLPAIEVAISALKGEKANNKLNDKSKDDGKSKGKESISNNNTNESANTSDQN